MSLIIGKYYRGNPKQKPKQWGPASRVLADKSNGPNVLCHIPFWERCGVPNSLVAHVSSVTNGSWDVDRYRIQAGSLALEDGALSGMTSQHWTVLLKVKTNSWTDYNLYKFFSVIGSNAGDGIQLGWRFQTEASNLVKPYVNFSNNWTASGYTSTVATDLNNGLIAYTYDGTSIRFYFGRELLVTTALGGHPDDLSGATYAVNATTHDATYDSITVLNRAITLDEYQYFYDNPYALIQPPTFRTYFDLAESGAISADVLDGFNASDGVGRTAILSAASNERMILADTDQNIGSFIADLVTQIAMSVLTDRAAILDGVAGDDIRATDTGLARADLAGSANDMIQFSGDFLSSLQAMATITEIVNLIDTASTDAISVISALVADVFNIYDGALARADLVSAIIDNIDLSDGANSFLKALAASAETINIRDAAFWHGLQYAFAVDGISLNDPVETILTADAVSVDSIIFDDSGSVVATFDVEVNSSVQFTETILNIASFKATVSDGIGLTATPLEVSTLPNGKVSVSFSIKTATVVFNLK